MTFDLEAYPGDPPPPIWQQAFAGLPIPAWRWYRRVSSTQDVAWAWAELGAADGVLVAAEAQTAGRGRAGRRWYSRPGASLTVSVVARPFAEEQPWLSRYTAWAALAMADALASWGVNVRIKWPNDLLLDGRKIGGVLVELHWRAAQPEVAILGVGVNLSPEAVPRPEQLDFPAGSIAGLRKVRIPAPTLAAQFWRAWTAWRGRLTSFAFLAAWDARLAYRGQWVEVRAGHERWRGILLGLREDGALRLRTPSGERAVWQVDHLRPLGQ
ncbi:MAG: biotin--[acetyl-CoA-carboxylase] ligase [Chloroflexi bacterium]|nr:biotin--[acetyl-CoA-carboxylase] ligase [Chloroflexota bacterium]